MAKSFKQLPSPKLGVPSKPLSEQDFFDLTEDPVAPVNLVAAAAPLESHSAPGLGAAATIVEEVVSVAAASPALPALDVPIRTPGKRVSSRPTGNTGLPDKPEKAGKPASSPIGNENQPAELVLLASSGVRQTFVVGAAHLEKLRDYVHERRSRGEYYYSQRQALEEALDLLFAGSQPVAPRPAHLRERERQQRVRIREGRRSGTDRSKEVPPVA